MRPNADAAEEATDRWAHDHFVLLYGGPRTIPTCSTRWTRLCPLRRHAHDQVLVPL